MATVEPNDQNVGLGWPLGKLAEAVHEMCGRWGVHPHGVSDDARGLENT